MILLIVGKSGSGKTAIMEELVKLHGYHRVITCTTRKRREGEAEDAYHFMTEEEFHAAMGRGEFMEYDTYRGNLYGTHKDAFKDADYDHKMVCVITPEGAEAVKKEYPDACILYLDTSMKDSVVRAIARLSELTPKDLKTISVCAATDEYLYDGITCDTVVKNQMSSNLYSVVKDVVNAHEQWHLHYMMQDTNKELKAGLDLIREAYTPDRSRCLELLGACIEEVMVGRSVHEAIGKLLDIGFTADELVCAFNFTRKDVGDVLTGRGMPEKE